MAAVLEAARSAGASHAAIVLLRLPGPVATVFEERLRDALPLRADKVMRRIRETRGGKLYDSRFGVRRQGRGRLRRDHPGPLRVDGAQARVPRELEPAPVGRSRGQSGGEADDVRAAEPIGADEASRSAPSPRRACRSSETSPCGSPGRCKSRRGCSSASRRPRRRAACPSSPPRKCSRGRCRGARSPP